MGPTRIADLVLLGLDESDARTYLALLTDGATTDEVVAKLLDASVPAIHASFAALNEAGLVSLAVDGTIATPMRPGPASTCWCAAARPSCDRRGSPRSARTSRSCGRPAANRSAT